MPEFSVRGILLHPVTIFVACVIGVIVTCLALWDQNSNHFLNAEKYALTADRIFVSSGDMTEELKAGIVEEVFAQNRTAENPTTLETGLVARVASFVESQPYVQQVSVRKTASNLHVDALIRRPVGIVTVGSMQLAVDAEGVILDGRAYLSQTPDDFLRITLDRPNNQGLNTWDRWPDPRVVAAAEICHQLESVWKEFGLYRVVTYWRPNQKADSSHFEVWTKFGGKVIWAEAIPKGHIAPEQKIYALQRFIEQNGPLEKLAGEQILDLRSGEPVLIKEERVADQSQIDFGQSSRGELDR